MEPSNSEKQSNPRVNDLIFRELVKRQYSKEGDTRVWDLADSKLWYLTDQQAQGFIDLENNEDYRKTITGRETGLIKEHIPDILQVLPGSHYNIVDLGCGDGKKAALLIEQLRGKLQLRYCPIDISSYMVETAAQTIRGLNAGEVIQFRENISDFENLSNVVPRFREGEFQNNFLMLLGNTLGNFDRDDILHGIRQAIKDKDALLIGNGLNGNRGEDEVAEPYKDKTLDDFLIHVVKQIGLDPEDVEYSARFKNSRVEMFYRLKADKTVRHLSKSVDFKEDDEVLVAISYKFSKEELEAYLRRFFGNVRIYTDEKQTYGLALCSV